MPVAQIDINRIDLAVLVSVLLHAAFLAIPIAQRPGEKGNPQPFVARLVEARERIPEAVPVPQALPAAKPVPRAPQPRVPTVRPPTLAEPAPVAQAAPTEVPRATPAPQFDMLAMINERRQRREALEDALAERETARGVQGAANPNEAALAAINRNLQTLSSGEQGTGGVFTILSKGHRVGEFSFNGWRPDTNRRWREVIEVDAGPGGDVERAIVRRMIQLIRGHYTGDFIWRSPRLGKSLVLSARVEHSEELEKFLIREFFGTPTLAHGR